MLTVEHMIRASRIHGLGVFIQKAAKKGEVIWRFDSLIDKRISFHELAGLPMVRIYEVIHHAQYFEESKTFVLASDGDYYMNHSTDPSLIDHGEVMLASRDLAPGVELTCDYRIVQVLGFIPDGRMHSTHENLLLSGKNGLIKDDSSHMCGSQ